MIRKRWLVQRRHYIFTDGMAMLASMCVFVFVRARQAHARVLCVHAPTACMWTYMQSTEKMQSTITYPYP